MSDILKKLQPIFQDIFEDDELLIAAESNADTVEDWDSLTHIVLIFTIEQEFEIKFALGELEAMKNVGDMVELMQTKLSK
jgi:acyl carrier protein